MASALRLHLCCVSAVTEDAALLIIVLVIITVIIVIIVITVITVCSCRSSTRAASSW